MARRSAARPLPELLAVREDRGFGAARGGGQPSPSDVISVYLEGGPRYRLGEITYEFEPPVGILLPRGVHDEDLQRGRIRGAFAVFRGEGLLRAGGGRPGARVELSLGRGRQTAPCLKELRFGDAGRLAGTLSELGAVRRGGALGRLRRTALLLRAICEYCEARPRRGAGGVHRVASRLRALVDEMAFENIPLARIYERLDASAAHAETLFAAAYGLTPVAYRRGLRLRRARELLVSSQKNVSETAYAVGFTDPLYFSRVFRTRFGVTPSSLISNYSARRR
ncbi:MAG: helix-turn-helix transcriptional regulator [Planctomycetota bacterium]|jgi:AraC-like DNA-binding protein